MIIQDNITGKYMKQIKLKLRKKYDDASYLAVES
jgi:hypothetical protein